MEIGRVPLALLVVVGLGACGTTGAGLLESDARIIWEQAPSCELTGAAPEEIPGVVTIGRGKAVEVQIEVDGSRGVVTEAVILGQGSGTTALDAALIEATLQMRFHCVGSGLTFGRRVYFI